MHICSTSVDNGLRVKAWDARQTFHQTSIQNTLPDRNEDGTTELLSKEVNRDTDRNVLLGKRCLDSEARCLHSKAEAKTDQKLVGNPMRRARVGLKSGQKSLADGQDTWAYYHGRDIIANALGNGSRENTSNHKTQDKRDGVDAGVNWADTLGSLD